MDFFQFSVVIWSVLSTLTTVKASENLVGDKSTNQSSTYANGAKRVVSDNAIDGCTDHTRWDTCCSHTDVGHKETWWQVDLQQQYLIETVNIIYRSGYLHRLAGFEIYLSNTSDWTSGERCYQDNTASLASMSTTQNVTCPGIARYVTIYNDRRGKAYTWYSDNAILELCEVYVKGCQVGRYGNENCNNNCSGCLGNTCNPTSGKCDSCAVGFYKVGDYCMPCPGNCEGGTCNRTNGACSECVAGFYGSHCNQSCPENCKNNLCNMNDGKCTEGCTDEFSGDLCRCPINCNDSRCPDSFCKDCNDGYYGPLCKQCPAGCSTDTCEKTSGNCTQCDAGFHGSHCNQSCPVNCKAEECNITNGQCTECNDGFYGNFCNNSCPDNCSTTCTMLEGQCTECDDGFHGMFCNKSCPENCFKTCTMIDGQCKECTPGKYGEFCIHTCPDHCSNDLCEQMHGNCTDCDGGFHGNFCNQTCPTNCKNDICRKVDGQCIETKALTSEPDNQTTVFAGTGAGVVAVIAAAIVVIVVVVLRRRKKNTKHKTNTRFDDVSETTLSSEPAKQKLNSGHPKKSMPLVDDASDYINVCDVDKEEVIYSNTSGVSIDEIRDMIPKKMENEEEEFQKEFKMLPWGAIHPHLEATKPANIPKNRFKTTFPYDHSRVILHNIGNDPGSTYINANYIDSVDACKMYVACQGPKEKTVDDFWRMIWQLNTGKIVMVTNLVEGGNVKCHQYWPNDGEPIVSKHFNITLDRERMYAFYVLREISLSQKETKEERQIHQFHFTAWPDHGTPNNLELVLFHRRITSHTTHLTGQMVVHCSAGLGRTGTFIGLDALSREAKKSGRVDISQYIRTMRKDRMNMVQTHEQYIAIHELLVETADLTDTLISSTKFPETLSNILPAGKPTNQTKLRKEFEKLQTLVPKYDSRCYTAGTMESNKDKNRTMSNVAVDKFRAFLQSQRRGRTDYINAVLLQSHRSKSGYLMTQFPLADTVDDFWTMVTDYNCENIVVLGTPTEHWLRDENETNKNYEVYVEKQKEFAVIQDVDIIDYIFKSKISNSDATVRVYTMKTWSSDSLLPPSDSSLLLLLEQLDSRRRSDSNKPVIVMCRNGCTQSGLFCCVSNARDQMKMDEEVDIFQNSRQIQIRRPQALRNVEQYQYCYSFIGQYLESTNVYIN